MALTKARKAKKLLNRYAPKGEKLAYINDKEAKLLKKIGGSGKMTTAGIRSYTEDEEDTGDVSNSGSSSSSNGGGGGNDNGGGNNQPASYRSVAAKTAAPKSKTLLDYSPTFQAVKFVFNTAKKVFKNIGGRVTQKRTSYNPMNEQPFNKPIIGGGGGSDTATTQVAKNLGGKIIKSPTTAEVSQSSATDVTYDARKTKARGRSLTIRTNSRGVGNNMASVLGKKSLLGAA